MVFDHTPLTPSPPNLNYEFLKFALKMVKLTLYKLV